MKILILCTGNSCRSQMAEGVVKNLHPAFTVVSAGTRPEKAVNPFAIKVMLELGIDISGNQPKNVDQFIDQTFDYVVTVCDHAKEVCPVFSGSVAHRVHIGFEDPADAIGTPDQIILVYRKVRDEIKEAFTNFDFR